MILNKLRKFSPLIPILILVIIVSCGESTESPKKVVIKLFGAMERDDRAAIKHYLDLPAIMEKGPEDYALKADTARVFHSPADILDDMTGQGKTKSRWFALKRVIGKQTIKEDTAFVEVSFIDEKNSIQYYNKFGLHKKDGRWQIYSFRTLSGE